MSCRIGVEACLARVRQLSRMPHIDETETALTCRHASGRHCNTSQICLIVSKTARSLGCLTYLRHCRSAPSRCLICNETGHLTPIAATLRADGPVRAGAAIAERCPQGTLDPPVRERIIWRRGRKDPGGPVPQVASAPARPSARTRGPDPPIRDEYPAVPRHGPSGWSELWTKPQALTARSVTVSRHPVVTLHRLLRKSVIHAQ